MNKILFCINPSVSAKISIEEKSARIFIRAISDTSMFVSRQAWKDRKRWNGGSNMRRDIKSKIKRERMIMVASSALVMGALTLTGIYIKGQSDRNTDDGYSVDFSALEDSIDDKAQEIAQNQQENNAGDTKFHMELAGDLLDDATIELLKKAGFRMAFAGELNDSTVRVGQDKYRIPRYVIVNYTTMNDFIRYVS